MDSKVSLVHPKIDYIGCDINWNWPLAISDDDKRNVNSIEDIPLRDGVKCEFENIIVLRHVIKVLECFININMIPLDKHGGYLHVVSSIVHQIPGDNTCLHFDYQPALGFIKGKKFMSKAAAELYELLVKFNYSGVVLDPRKNYIKVHSRDVHFKEALLELDRYIVSSLPYRLLIEALRFFKSHKLYNADGWTDKRFECIYTSIDYYKALFPPLILWRAGTEIGYRLRRFKKIELKLANEDASVVAAVRAAAIAAGDDASLIYYYEKPEPLPFTRSKFDMDDYYKQLTHVYYTEQRVETIRELIAMLKEALVILDVPFSQIMNKVNNRLPLQRIDLQGIINNKKVIYEFQRIEEEFPEISKKIGRCEGELPFYKDGNILKVSVKEQKDMARILRKLIHEECKYISWEYLAKVFFSLRENKLNIVTDDTVDYWKKVKYYYRNFR